MIFRNIAVKVCKFAEFFFAEVAGFLLMKLLWGRSKKKERGTWVVGKKKEREKKWYVGGSEKRKEKKKREGIYNGIRGEGGEKWKMKIF